MIRPAREDDCGVIADIYNHYIEHTIVTFEEEQVNASEMWRRMSEVEEADLPWLVALQDDRVVGYAYASKWKGRCGYRFSAEATVYLAPTATGAGWGSRLYRELFSQLRRGDTRVVIGGVALPNDASVALHEKLGMEKVAHFRDVGFKFDRWIDVAYWQRHLVPVETGLRSN